LFDPLQFARSRQLMSLGAGARLGPYEIVSAIGAGGMGEVYRARDTRLKREVALKILPASFAGDPDRLARFQREAEVLASLNHPNIAAIHGLEEADGIRALVMELVEGETLADRIARGAIARDEALPIAKQIAEALEAAHEQGIIHRDLKPANIKVRPDGTVKVLDFGLAKLNDSNAQNGPNGPNDPNAPNGPNVLSMSPTITSPALMTGVGVLLGTAAYMSPEQAKGRPADKRSDIWAFGCVLYEMLTGKRAFEGDDVADTLAAVLRADPDWAALPAMSPIVTAALKRCLQKDRRHRLADVSAVLFTLHDSAAIETVSGSPTVSSTRRWRLVSVLGGALLGGVLVALVEWTLRPDTPRAVVTRFPFVIPEGQAFNNPFLPSVAISPDGTQIAYVANSRLYVRSMSESAARPIAGSESETNIGDPVFSPDSQSIVFWVRTGSPNTTGINLLGALKRIPISGGTAVTVAQVDRIPLGLRWENDALLYGQVDGGVMRVPAAGGRPEPLLAPVPHETTLGPQILAGGDAVLFTAFRGGAPTILQPPDAWDRAAIVVASIKSGERKTVIPAGSDARYTPTGHLVYLVGGVVFGVPFDARRGEVTGGPVPVLEGVLRTQAGNNGTGLTHFSISGNGSIAYVPGPMATGANPRDLVVIDQKGAAQVLNVARAPYRIVRVSPNGAQLALDTDNGRDASVWIYDLSGASSMRRLTLEGRNGFPIWTADGQRVAFQSDRQGAPAVFWQRVDGTAAAERLTTPDEGAAHTPMSWSPDGKRFLFYETKNQTSTLWTFSMDEKKATPFPDSLTTSGVLGARFSPDGRWVAYLATNGAVLRQLLVQPFPPTGAKYLVSDNTQNAEAPRWSRDGARLYYVAGPRMVVVDVRTRTGFSVGNPTSLPPQLAILATNGTSWDVMPDGQRFVATTTPQSAVGPADGRRIEVILNWFEELKTRVPVK
jgi:serine/threonine-protein kinase